VDKVLVVNTSPLIYLARINRLDLLASLAKLKAAHRAALAELDALLAFLQHRAFHGAL